MKKQRLKYLALLLLVLCTTLPVCAQVTFEARIDTLVLLIGQQRELTLELTCNKGQKIEMPQLQPEMKLNELVEVVDLLSRDTSYIDDGKRLTLTERWSITAFDSALVYLEPFNARVDGKPYQTKSLGLKVLTMPIDTVHVDQFFGPKDIQNNPFAWSDWSPLFWWSLLAVLVLLALIYVALRYYQNKPIVRIIKRTVKLPPHQVAMAEIERIKAERKWAEEDSKEYYTLLTDALRGYIRDRYHFNATEMTSTEIIQRLMQEQDEHALDELRQLFQTADLVKFAKWTTLINENDMNLVNAIDFINQTKIEVDPNAKPEPEVITVEEKQNRTRSIVMRVAIVLLAAAAVALTGYVIWRAVELML